MHGQLPAAHIQQERSRGLAEINSGGEGGSPEAWRTVGRMDLRKELHQVHLQVQDMMIRFRSVQDQ